MPKFQRFQPCRIDFLCADPTCSARAASDNTNVYALMVVHVQMVYSVQMRRCDDGSVGGDDSSHCHVSVPCVQIVLYKDYSICSQSVLSDNTVYYLCRASIR